MSPTPFTPKENVDIKEDVPAQNELQRRKLCFVACGATAIGAGITLVICSFVLLVKALFF